MTTLLKVCLLAVVAGGVLANDSTHNVNVRKLYDELQQLAHQQQQKIEVMKSDRERRLEPAASEHVVYHYKTIYEYNFTDRTDKSPYSVKESFTFALDQAWMIICGALVMFMQAGFAMVSAGSVRAKNVNNALLKNLVDVSVGTLGWYMVGWSFAWTSAEAGGFAGTQGFAGNGFSWARDDGQQEPTDKMARWFLQWAFCVTACTIVSGGLAERVNLLGYTFFSLALTCVIYPIVVGATWGKGFLATSWMNDSGYVDYAGSGIIHMTGGVAALVGAFMVGPRVGRFSRSMSLKDRVLGTPEGFEPHSLPLVVLGTFILWFGWYGLNCGATMSMSKVETAMMAAQIAMNTSMSAAAGGITVFVIRRVMFKKYCVHGFCNGIMAGLVSISAGCSNVESGAAIVIGLCGGIVYQFASSMLKVLRIDDVVDAFPIHGAAGLWGVIAAALFDWGFGFYQVSGFSGFKCIKNHKTLQCKGLADGMGKDLVSSNFTEAIFILAWVAVCSTIVFLPLKLTRHLKVADDEEDAKAREENAVKNGAAVQNAGASEDKPAIEINM